MKKKILITGATDGIGLATAKMLAEQGHQLLLHGRNQNKLAQLTTELSSLTGQDNIQTYLADLSNFADVYALLENINAEHQTLDVLINNAGVFKVNDPMLNNGLDVRFMVNTIVPYLLTKQLTPLLGKQGRVINLSSAAQAPVNIEALKGNVALADMDAYAQSKLAITMWTYALSTYSNGNYSTMLAVNPGSLLASKMVKKGFGVAGKDINIGANILTRLAIEKEIEHYSGQYFDNDKGEFSLPHPDGINEQKCDSLVKAIESIIGG